MLPAILTQIIHTLKANKLRSFLTMFGITWGVLSIILMTASGEGFKVAQRDSLALLGRDILIVWGGKTSVQSEGFQSGRDIRLEYSDYEAIRDHAHLIKYVSPEIIRGDLVAKTDINFGNFSTRGVLPEYQFLRTITAAHGRQLTEGDNREARAVCVIGSEVNKQLYNGEVSIDQVLSLNGYPFKVVGIMPHKDLNNTYQGQDHSAIFIPYETMKRLFSNPYLGHSREYVDNLIAAPIQHAYYREAELEVREVLAKKKLFDPQDEDAIGIWNTGKQVEMMDIMMGSMQWFMGTVGMITLLLGAVGVINIMLVSVRERTMEIGLRKSVGATRSQILVQFFAESLVITLIAGGFGLLFGWAICSAINRLPLPEMVFAGMIVSPAIGIIACCALVLIGIGAGIYPAYIAADMDPIEALRFEAN